jgi:hypothetical protein
MLAIGLVLAFIGGALGSRVLAAYRSINTGKGLTKGAVNSMRAARLRWLFWAVVAFGVGWLWIHGNL